MKNRLTVLNYHQVPEVLDPMHPDSCDRAIFRAQMAVLKRYFNVLPLPEAYAAMRAGNLPRYAVVITFDDGYHDNYTVAFEELSRVGLPAAFFIATDYLDGGRMWNDTIIEAVRRTPHQSLDLSAYKLGTLATDTVQSRYEAVQAIVPVFKYMEYSDRLAAVEQLATMSGADLPDRLMMTSHEVRELHDAGMTIGAHTASHPILRRLSPDDACHDIERGRDFLSSLLSATPEFFAYPNGKPGQDYDPVHVEQLADLGFTAAFTTQWGYADGSMNRHELPRVGFGGHTGWGFGLRLLRSYFEAPAMA